MNIIDQIRRAKRAATPLLAIETPDQQGLVSEMRKLGNGSEAVLLEWDCIAGIRPCTARAKALMTGIEYPDQITDPTEAVLKFVATMGGKSILALHNAGLFLDSAGLVQALSTVRDTLKSNGRAIVLMGVSLEVPTAIRHDTVLLRESLPDNDRLLGIVTEAAGSYRAYLESDGEESAGFPEGELVTAAANLRGLSAFAAEQAAMTAVMDTGTFASVGEERNNAIDATPGLSVDRGTVTYDDMRGCARAIEYMKRLCSGPESPQLILRVDEIEKSLGGSNDHDRAGATGADELRMMLQSMEDWEWSGVICYGHPGTAKSMLCKATGPTFRIPSIALDLGGTRGKYVGESEANIRSALDTVRTIGGSRVHVMATCNELDSLPPELRRRFTDGIMFFDLPSMDERLAMWSLYMERYGIDLLLSPENVPDMEGLTGAEIRNICRLAHRMQVTLAEAALDVVPIVKSDRQGIERRRSQADGRYRSAATPGVYSAPKTEVGTGRELG